MKKKADNKKITVKKIKSVAKGAAKNTGKFMKKASKVAVKEAGQVAKSIKKEWVKSAPQREVYKKELKDAAKKAGAKGFALLKSGLKNSLKIGGDVADIIKKDIKEIRSKKNGTDQK
jgi:hypothetical protein